jgi:hypothetical protein
VIVQTQFGWHVVEVLERQTTTLAEATRELRRTALQAERQSAVQGLLKETSAELGIKVNPRFGRYNPDTGQVEPVEGANDVLSPAPGDGGEDPLVGPGGELPPGAEGEAPPGAEGEAPPGARARPRPPRCRPRSRHPRRAASVSRR